MISVKITKSYSNLKKAMDSLNEAIALPIVVPRDMAGVIQNFEFVYELTWKTLKTILDNEKISANFPREVFEKSFHFGILDQNEVWVDIMQGRNLSTHTYDASLAEELYKKIKLNYLSVFQKTVSNIDSYIQKQV